MSSIESPCVSVCRMDTDNKYCIGCWRTVQEIGMWRTASDDVRQDILTQLHTRREAAGGRARRGNKRRG